MYIPTNHVNKNEETSKNDCTTCIYTDKSSWEGETIVKKNILKKKIIKTLDDKLSQQQKII